MGLFTYLRDFVITQLLMHNGWLGLNDLFKNWMGEKNLIFRDHWNTSQHTTDMEPRVGEREKEGQCRNYIKELKSFDTSNQSLQKCSKAL